MPEKRIKNRVTKRLSVRFGASELNNNGITSNLSPTGIFIRTNSGLAPGTFVNIELTLPGDRILKLKGTVMWTKRVHPKLAELSKNGMGIMLADIPEEYAKFVTELLK
ncbi:MAG: PilZ domain-containing protein [Nitrospirae bacterium]|nr:PilZ domain-containing protein [Nitrospirota bacterium]